jgi:DNA invertase Pin-like site-specific DNA recombinase
MRQLLTNVDALKARGIGLRSLHENIDTTSATGRLIIHIFAALGQFEVELLRERTQTALAASRARGRVGGRPPALNAIQVRAASAMLASGTMSASEVARQVGCSSSTLYRHVSGDAPPWPKAECQPPRRPCSRTTEPCGIRYRHDPVHPAC